MRSRAGYQRLPPDSGRPYREEEDSGRDRDARFDVPQVEVPWASVALALFLMAFGIFSFVLAWLHFTQRLLGKEQAEIGFSILAFMTFTPGAYHTWLAYGAWRGWRDYTWDLIPAY